MPISLTAAVAGGLTFLSTSPTPGPGSDGLRPGLSADQVTPGFLGFAMTAFMVIAVVFLMVSMTRRIRRVRYRAQFSAVQAEASQSGEGGTENPSEPKPM
ncbi:MAG: hypothetical protein WAL27_14745 [Cellulosimicrobium cellulans]